ncbi:aspartyl-tRNA(Asn)/glutamyl-tRNA(Gln) amidotransferase subunit C [Clostridium algifaecis]|uniref:Aspartyl/glutamyl-tRNA(Asn/Gln) amidotransferase subunit C n=1 Tax=Clostridium algifaecis TaxID=1472040 RepID=A0ABS4KT50_9CLOT|nr:Asp-tRNA(Asn)/Glu-tRNA(Gln) amidotransferase subunit GatC [Clostridium algifaecis]MBP2033207.1 aspartyl-tRNA(Asn)/glutamyl-tRNA(Gln) amidotransferase subunit C [Clostridium algifaecis]
MFITRKEFKYVADLSRLEFKEDEEIKLIDELNEILGYIDKLNELDVENEDELVNPYYIENRFREDKIEKSMEIDKVIENSPEHIKSYIAVPKIIK